MFTEDELKWIGEVLSTDDSDPKLTEDELNWIKKVFVDQHNLDFDAIIEMPPHYVRLKKERVELRANKEIARKELDTIRKNAKKFTPEELIELKTKNVRESKAIENFAGIYIIHNSVKDIYYVGQSKGVFDRAYQHFVTNPAENKARYEGTVEFNLPEIYDDYRSGDKFNINLIPLGNTSFSTLNELERNGICAYDASVEYGGYNRTNGNVINKSFFSEEYQKVAEFMLDKIKEKEEFISLTNGKKRFKYIIDLFYEFGLPNNYKFISSFVKMIQEYQKANKVNK